MEKKYRWASPHEWLEEKAQEWDQARLLSEVRNLAMLLDSDQLQDEYQTEMDQDGYFKPVEED